MMNLEFLGLGEDKEPLHLEVVSEACVLVHASGNSESPFEFPSEKEARQFAGFIVKFRLEQRLEKFIHE